MYSKNISMYTIVNISIKGTSRNPKICFRRGCRRSSDWISFRILLRSPPPLATNAFLAINFLGCTGDHVSPLHTPFHIHENDENYLFSPPLCRAGQLPVDLVGSTGCAVVDPNLPQRRRSGCWRVLRKRSYAYPRWC